MISLPCSAGVFDSFCRQDPTLAGYLISHPEEGRVPTGGLNMLHATKEQLGRQSGTFFTGLQSYALFPGLSLLRQLTTAACKSVPVAFCLRLHGMRPDQAFLRKASAH